MSGPDQPLAMRWRCARGGAPQPLAGPPLVALLHQPEVHERLRYPNPGDLAEPLAKELEQVLVVLRDALDEDVVRAGGDHDVVGLGELGDLLRDLDQSRRLD